MKPNLRCPRATSRAFLVLAATLLAPQLALADGTYQTLPFFQDWSDTGMITANDDWSGVPGIIGYLGDLAGSTTGVDPQTHLGGAVGTAVDVIANQSTPNSQTAGGVAEFDGIANPAVALQGSGGADAPHIVVHVNTTGASGIAVAYDLIDLDGSGDNAVQQVALHYRVGAAGSFTNVAAAYVADATEGPSLSGLVTPVCVVLPPAVDNQAQVELRVMTTNAPGSDEWVAIDNIAVFAGGSCNRLTVTDEAQPEGDSGTSTMTFTVSLSEPAPVGGVTFDITTVADVATSPEDYVHTSATGAFIPEGETDYDFDVTINGDTDPEPDETFFVVVSNVVGDVVVVKPQGIGTILNDDVFTLEIHEIQGAGATTPFDGQVVITNDNIVTALASDGFFMQTPNERADLDLETSQGIFVFTGGAPGVQVGDQVDVQGVAQEFFGLTELVASSVSIDATGLSLPTAVVFDAMTPSPDQPVSATEFERYESMLISITGGSIGSGNQRFSTDILAEPWVTAGPRAFREPGVIYPGLPGLPVWDNNPEVFELDQDRLAGMPAATPVLGGSTFDAVGVLGFEFNGWELWPTSLTIHPVAAEPVPEPATDELTIGSLNVFRLFDTIDDPDVDDPVIPLAEYQRRLEKFSRYIREQLRSPDIIGIQEVEKLEVLEALADRIEADDPSVVYTAYLEEGNDVGGIDVGFLVRNTVTVVGTTQLSPDEIFSFPTFPDASLHDRPPFLLEATWVDSAGVVNPLDVIVVHQRSLSGIDGAEPNASRVRQKRFEQAQSLAQHIQDLQTAVDAAPLVVIGDFNAFEFTDGYVDVIGQIRGEVDPDDNLLSGPELVDPVLTNQVLTLPANQRYSFIFGGSAQVLDHALTSEVMDRFVRWFAYGRGNTDAAVDLINDAGTALRSSDHDGFVLAIVGMGIFADGFESGDTSAWSAVAP